MKEEEGDVLSSFSRYHKLHCVLYPISLESEVVKVLEIQ